MTEELSFEYVDPTQEATGYKKIKFVHNYVVISTGYETRLIDDDDSKEFFEELTEQLKTAYNVSKKQRNIELLFVFDGVNYHNVGSNKKEVKTLVTCTKKIGMCTDMVHACFKCSDKIYDCLERTIIYGTYCGGAQVEKIEEYFSDNDDEPSIKYVQLDAESG